MYKQEFRVECVNKIITKEESVNSLHKKTGINRRTLQKWLDKVAPDFHSAERLEELDIEQIHDKADRLAAAARVVAITRMLDIIKKEKNLQHLASALRELKQANEADPANKTTNHFTQYVVETLKQFKDGS